MYKQTLKIVYPAILFILSLPIWLAPSFASAQALQFENPLRFRSIEEFIEGALQAFVYIALPVIAFFVVLSGFRFIAAQGDPGKLGAAKENFKNVLIGGALVLGAWALAVLIKGTIDQLRS